LFEAAFGERGTVDVFHSNRRESLALHEIVNAHDMGMGERAAALRFLLELTKSTLIEHHHFGQKLERHLGIQSQIEREPNHTHTAPTEDFLERVAPEHPIAGTQRPNRGVALEFTGVERVGFR
jgi:hypothetical protein